MGQLAAGGRQECAPRAVAWMIISPRAWGLLCLTLVALGCDDGNGGDDSGVEPEEDWRCSGDELQSRADGVWRKVTDCAAEGAVCGADDAGVAACVTAPCNDGEKNCDGDVLVVCEAGEWNVEQDCASLSQVCMPLLGGLPRCADPF